MSPVTIRPGQRLVWSCSSCQRGYVAAEPVAIWQAGFGDGADWWTPRRAAPAGADTDPGQWRRVGSRYLYCPSCWAARADRRPFTQLADPAFTMCGQFDLSDGSGSCVCGNDGGFFPTRATHNPVVFGGLDPDRDQPTDAEWGRTGCPACGAVYDLTDDTGRPYWLTDTNQLVAAPVIGAALTNPYTRTDRQADTRADAREGVRPVG